MRGSRDLIAVILLLLGFVVGGLLLGGRGAVKGRMVSEESSPDPAITNDRASGSMGVYKWVGRLGYHPAQWRKGWGELDPNSPDLLLIVDPQVQEPMATLTGGGLGNGGQTSLSAKDAATLRRWLAGGRGHVAVLLTSRLSSGHGGPKPSSDDQDTFGDALDVIVESASPDTGRREFAPLQPVRDTRGMVSLRSESDARIKRTASDGIALFGDRAGPLALTIPVGKGKLIAVADGGLFSNGMLPRSENAMFLANLLAHYAPEGGRVLFDEYHHGDEESAETGSVWDSLGRPLQLASVQACLALAALAVLLAVRFGPPVPLVRNTARTSAEYVTSLASLYRRAEASGTALETLYRQFLRDVCGRLALPPDVPLERLAEVAARRGQVDRGRMRSLLAACELRLDRGQVSERDLLDLTQQMERIRKDMGIA